MAHEYNLQDEDQVHINLWLMNMLIWGHLFNKLTVVITLSFLVRPTRIVVLLGEKGGISIIEGGCGCV